MTWDELCEFIESLGYGFPLNACSKKGLEGVKQDLLRLADENLERAAGLQKAAIAIEEHLDPAMTTSEMVAYLNRVGIPADWYSVNPIGKTEIVLWAGDRFHAHNGEKTSSFKRRLNAFVRNVIKEVQAKVDEYKKVEDRLEEPE